MSTPPPPRPDLPASPKYVRGQTVRYRFRGQEVEGVIQRIDAVWHSYEKPHTPPVVRYEITHPWLRYDRAIVGAEDILTQTYIEEMRGEQPSR